MEDSDAAGQDDGGRSDLRACRPFVLLEVAAAAATTVEGGGAVVPAPVVPILMLLLARGSSSGGGARAAASPLPWKDLKGSNLKRHVWRMCGAPRGEGTA